MTEPSPPTDLDTLTMARIYLDQGRVEEAAAIYDRLVATACGEARQIADLRDVVERSLSGARAARRRAHEAPRELPARHGRDLVAVVSLGPGRVLCVWEATPRGRAAAAAQLGGRTGVLAVRLVTATPGDGATARVTRDLPQERDVGEAQVAAPARGGFVCAAVGLLAADGRFAPIAHSEVVPLAATEAEPATAGAFLEVEPARGGPDCEPPEPRLVEP